MSRISKQLGAFSDYFALVRQIGHTTAMMEGVKRIDAIVVTHDQNMSQRLSDPNFLKTTPQGNQVVLRQRERGSKIRTMGMFDDVNKLNGMNSPLVFDNAALFSLFSQASVEMNRLEAENEKLKRKIREAKFVLE